LYLVGLKKGNIMQKLSQIYLILLIFHCSVSAGSSWVANSGGTIYDQIHNKADLPTGGKFVEHPNDSNIHYYFTTTLGMWPDKENAQKHSGLYISKDNGETWNLICNFFEFTKLFIHPGTGKLYCIIRHTWLETNEEGFLWPHTADKALMSNDGKHWKELIKGNGIADIADIIADPDNFGRVCLKIIVIRGYILQSKDDDYSEWIKYKEWDWPNRKEPTDSQLIDESEEE
jgi:hypothetical protein